MEWIQDYVLPQTVPGQILVMDNASIHRDERLEAIVQLYGVSIEYLPPYSPDYNSIELSFNQLKAWIRRHAHEAGAYSSFGDFLAYAIKEFETGTAEPFFEKCS